ncbi:MAG TPA: hypothetical protein VMS31_14780, partial [Pyrinomonadaceae bacterium]|nr:hypothetical protein [Pyrinomonadaceae bacterium]
MASTSQVLTESLPREMQQHTYAIMRRVEETHWWFAGRRQIIRSFLERLSPNPEQAGGAEGRSTSPLSILDVGCGTGANLEMLSEFGDAAGVDI